MRGQHVAVFILHKRWGGGTTSFVAHLVEAFKAANAKPILYTVHTEPRGERTPAMMCRPFGEYGMDVISVTKSLALQITRSMPAIITSPIGPANLPPNFLRDIRRAGAWGVIHDATQFPLWSKLVNAPSLAKLDRMICIRPAMQSYVPKAVFIRHPYVRSCQNTSYSSWEDRRVLASSIARVHNQKRTHLILQANRLLRKSERIEVLGAEYRLYSYGLAKRFPDVFKQAGGELQWALRIDCAPKMLEDSCFNVDMSRFLRDGGGTQYSQLEAMDAGCINIMHNDWFDVPGTLTCGKHVWTASTPEEIVRILKNGYRTDAAARIREDCYEMLKKHDPKRIGKQYLSTLGA